MISRRFNLRTAIAVLSAAAIALHLIFRFVLRTDIWRFNLPLMIALVIGGIPLLYDLIGNLIRRKFGSDLLAGLSIVTALILGEYLAGTIIVLMLSGGQALESYAVRRASAVLQALARRMPSIAHRKRDSVLIDVPVEQIEVGDVLEIFPHEVCPVDGVVLEGHGIMDESYLTGEPFRIPKAPGADVISGALNGDDVLTVRASRLAVDSRYAKIMRVMRDSGRNAPPMRRLGDQLGAAYTPIALAMALAAWFISGHASRFLAVLVIATPCPLLLAIPVAIIGGISLSARRGIIVKNPAVLEQLDKCRTVFFDKTGTLTYGRPAVCEKFFAPQFNASDVLSLAASIERYSKHPLAGAVLAAAHDAGLALREATEVSEQPGEGLSGIVAGRHIHITSRKKLLRQNPSLGQNLPAAGGGLECVILLDGQYAGTLRFRDQIRDDGRSFISHLGPRHRFNRMLILSGDRESEVRYLAERVGIREVFAGQTPEQKLQMVQEESRRVHTLYIGDGINDAPALAAATVGIALGKNSDITTEAAGAVILDSSLRKVDEFLHISRRMRRIALQSAVGGMILSGAGMILAAMGYLPPVAGAIAQEGIDVLAILNALRAAFPPRELTDF